MHGVNRRRAAVAHRAERRASTENLPSHTVTGNALPPEVVESSRKKAFGVAEKRQPTATLGRKVRQLNT